MYLSIATLGAVTHPLGILHCGNRQTLRVDGRTWDQKGRNKKGRKWERPLPPAGNGRRTRLPV